MHQVVTAQLAAARAGTHSTKTRAEVARRWREAVAPEGHRPRPPGLDPRRRTGVAVVWRTARSRATTRSARPRRWCGSRCARALSDRAAEGKVARRRRLGHQRRPKTKDALAAARRRSACARKGERDAARAARARSATDDDGVEVVPQPRRPRADRAARGAQHLRRARQRLARVLARRRSTRPSPGSPSGERRRRDADDVDADDEADGGATIVKDPRDIIIKPVVSEKSYAALRRERLHVRRRARRQQDRDPQGGRGDLRREGRPT